MIQSRDSYVCLQRRLRVNPGITSVLSDAQLLKLAHPLPADPALGQPIVAELWVRSWLYVGDTAKRFADAARDVTPGPLGDRLASAREAHDRGESLIHQAGVEPPFSGESPALCVRLKERLADFRRCDGLLALLVGHAGAAVAVPFLLQRPATSPNAVRDKSGRPIPAWSGEIHALRDVLGEGVEVVLLCSLGEAAGRVEGRSFMLPVALAHARRTGVCPAFPPLAVLATGALLHDSIAVVEGLDAKAGLAARLGAAFIAPECATGARTLGLRVGQPYRDVLPAVTSFLQGQGLTAMTPRQAAEGAMQLWGEVGVGAVSLPEAQARLAHYEDALQRAGDDLGTVDGIARVWLLRGSIANHSGRPAEADHCLAEAAARCAQHPVAFADTLASWVVSLTDLGQYDEAESLGRQLLYWVGAGFRGSEQDHARCRITACGALGGQPLLFKAVLGQETGAESLMLLQQARALALKLDSADHACRDAVQVALWHALLAPATYQGECDTACALLARYPGESAVSQGYLHRARLLGAYRAWLAGAAPGQGFDAWLLPDASIGHLGWVRATALKYRGALLANEGRTEESQADFDEALELLDAEGAPLIRFIAGTVALQAAESLGGTTARVGYLDAAETVFRAFAGWFQGPIAAERWLERATVLRQAGAPCGTSPQVWFPY